MLSFSYLKPQYSSYSRAVFLPAYGETLVRLKVRSLKATVLALPASGIIDA